MVCRLVLSWLVLLLLATNFIANASPVGVMDDLYDIARSSKKLFSVTKVSFMDDLIRLPVEDILPLIKSLPKGKRNQALLEIAEKRGMIKGIDVPYLTRQLRNHDDYFITLSESLKGKNVNLRKAVDSDLARLNLTRNGALAGKKHPTTGVRFTADGFPIFESHFVTDLPESLLKATDREQIKYLNHHLKKAISKDHQLAKKFTNKQFDQIKNGDTPSGYTWHHHQDSGRMELVETKIHQATGHTGGRSTWGGGSDYR